MLLIQMKVLKEIMCFGTLIQEKSKEFVELLIYNILLI